MEVVYAWANLLLLGLNIALVALNIHWRLKRRRRENVGTRQQIALKELEIEDDQRRYLTEREALLVDLGAHVFERNGVRHERIYNYRNQQRLESFDAEHQANRQRLQTELVHLWDAAGGVPELRTSRWRVLKMKLRSLFRWTWWR